MLFLQLGTVDGCVQQHRGAGDWRKAAFRRWHSMGPAQTLNPPEPPYCRRCRRG